MDETGGRPASAEAVEHAQSLGFDEMCQVCAAHSDQIIEMIEAGIIKPEGREASSWRFSVHTVIRSRKALRLKHDLGLNAAGLAVTLQLLDEVERLQTELKALRNTLKQYQS